MEWYTQSQEQIFKSFDVGENGLTYEQVESLRERYGENKVGKEEGVNYLRLALNQLKSPLILILLIAVVVTISLAEYIDALVITAVIVLNGVIGFVQEAKAERSVRSLQQMITPKTIVTRDGKDMEVPSASLVPGDIVSLVSGAMVPSDIRLFAVTELRVDESMLTGESVPAIKSIETLSESGLSPGDQANMVFMGTIVVNGRGKGVVVETGDRTMLGVIADTIRSAGKVVAPIREKIEKLAKYIGVLVMISTSLLFFFGLFLGTSVKEMFLTAVAAAVATVPEGLPIVVTIAMAVGVKRMVRYNAIIRNLPAVETLGSTTVICSDKIGTLTVNRMTVTHLFDGIHDVTVGGIGYAPEGDFEDSEGNVSILEESLLQVLRVGLLCNESRLVLRDDSWEVEGDPTEGALIVSAKKAGLRTESELAEWPRKAILPFESDRGFMATLHERN